MSALFGTYSRSIAFEKGKGMRLFTSDGTSYLDFMSGVGVNSLGHSDAHLIATMKNQAEKLWHVSNLYTIPEQEKLAQRLVDNSFAEAVFFTNSGAEAVECAIKTARRYFHDEGKSEKTDIIAFTGAFHGRTLGTIAAGGNESYLKGFGEPLAGFKHIEPNNIKVLEALIDEKTAAILIEPVQGEGGVNAISKGFMQELRKICDKHNLLLILDEVQSGYGRTGKLFAHEWSNVTPDIMAVAKGIGGGFPLGACLSTKKIAKAMVPGTHGSTYGGNPLACAIGNAVLDRILEPEFLPHVEEMSIYLNHSLHQLQQKFPKLIKQVRGKGLMVGLKIDPPIADFITRLREHHLLAVAAGDNVLRLLPPLIVTKSDIDEAIKIITMAFKEVEKQEKSNG
jgi:acetylornithine/N-succinyldiaminopimelate aminotransferase